MIKKYLAEIEKTENTNRKFEILSDVLLTLDKNHQYFLTLY